MSCVAAERTAGRLGVPTRFCPLTASPEQASAFVMPRGRAHGDTGRPGRRQSKPRLQHPPTASESRGSGPGPRLQSHDDSCFLSMLAEGRKHVGGPDGNPETDRQETDPEMTMNVS